MVWDFSDLNSNFYEFLKLQPFSGISYNKQKVRSRDDRHAAHSPSAREGLPGVIRGLPGGIREVCGSGSLGTRGATGGIRGKLTRHSGTQRIRGFREVFGSLGTRGSSEGVSKKASRGIRGRASGT